MGFDMCGRFVGFSTLETIVQYFPIDVINAEVDPNYNVAPTQKVNTVVRHDGKNHLEKLFWGLVPYWAKDRSIGSRMINARWETSANKPSFRAAFRKRRCLVIADGFYEWQKQKNHKQPMFLTLPGGGPFAFAGLWESWDDKGKAESPYRSCTILTRDASESVIQIHDRMPVVLKPEAYGPWLDLDQNIEKIQKILTDQIHTEFVSIPVSKRVNSVENNGAENIRMVEAI